MSEPNQQTFGICGIKLIDEKQKVLRHCSRIPKLIVYISCFGIIGFPKLGYVMSEWDHLTTKKLIM